MQALSNIPTRVIIDKLIPDLDRGRYAAKSVIGAKFPVSAVILCDGHEKLKADILYRHESEKSWRRQPLTLVLNDTYEGFITTDKPGIYYYSVEAAIDRFGGWRYGLFKKIDAQQATLVDLQIGRKFLSNYNEAEKAFTEQDYPKVKALINSNDARAYDDWNDPSFIRFDKDYTIYVDPKIALYGSWYEFFPRSHWNDIAAQGSLQDAASRLEYVADLGFDVVYLPPIHPIGKAFRKGKNNTLNAGREDVGSPWAIGSKDGGHKSIHPDLGTFADFDALIKKSRDLGIQIALDIAFQCSPDHPYVQKHPGWFQKRPDGTIQYAENPPKKYQDIYPFDFECEDWKNLWQELKSIFIFWIEKGVRIFRVDNPHTKSFVFWEWCIAEIKKDFPDIVFLAEAFTKPDVMAYLAKIGFSQSYTYFSWRNSKYELTQYMNELTKTELNAYFRPNFWPNTPDILPFSLQSGNRITFAQRLILAATLSASYGIYGPAYELLDSHPMKQGAEEYLDSEKYQVREWDTDQDFSLAPLIKRLNTIRRSNPAFQSNSSLMFHPIDNDQMLAYTKTSEDGSNIVLTIVNLDQTFTQSGFVDLQVHKLGLDSQKSYWVKDLLTGASYEWRGWKNFVQLNPSVFPAHIFQIEQPKYW